MLELLSLDGRSLAELMEEFRSKYFISGEINSEVADPAAKMAEIARALRRRRDHPPRRHLGRLPGLALQRPPLQHRAAAAAQPRVADLARGHGTPPRRGPGADPGVSALTPEAALEQAALAGIHRLQIPTPFAVGRVNCYLIEDEPLTLVDTGPNSGKALDELDDPARRPRPLDRRPRAGHRHPPAHRPPRPGRDRRRALRRRGGGARRRRRAARQLRRGRRGRGPLRGRADAAQRHPRGSDGGAAQRLPQLPRLGLARGGDAAAGRRRGDRASATAPCRRCTAPATAPRTPSSGTSSGRS